MSAVNSDAKIGVSIAGIFSYRCTYAILRTRRCVYSPSLFFMPSVVNAAYSGQNEVSAVNSDDKIGFASLQNLLLEWCIYNAQ